MNNINLDNPELIERSIKAGALIRLVLEENALLETRYSTRCSKILLYLRNL